MFNKGSELLNLCKTQNKKIWEIVVEKEIDNAQISYEELMNNMNSVLDTMINSANAALDKGVISISGLSGGDAKKWKIIKIREIL